jgi:hypothetical protein
VSAYELPRRISKLTERNGAPRHEDEKTLAIVKAAVQEMLGPLQKQHREEVQAIRAIAERMENGYVQLAKTLEAFAIGDEDVAVASVIDGESAQLPNLPRYKADATIVYPLKATDIGEALGLPQSIVSYFLGAIGLNWVTTKPRLWNQEFFRMTKRRLWHPDVIRMLADVITKPEHPDRESLSDKCAKRMDAEAPKVRAALLAKS